MRRYFLSAQNTMVPILTSFFVIPFLINLEGIEVWQSITIGQGVGLLFAEIVQGSWNQLGPKIGLNNAPNLHFLYSSSLQERKKRFLLCSLIGPLVILLVCETNLLFAEISFFIWLMNGLNAHWITLGTGDGIYTLKFFTIPRTIATVLGIVLSYVLDTLFVYLLIVLFTHILSIIVLKMAFRAESRMLDIRVMFDKKKRMTNTFNNLLAASNSWLLLILASIFHKTGNPDISILIRYSEFAFALMLVIPQLNHSAFIHKTMRTGRIVLINVAQAIFIVVIFAALFPMVKTHIFRDVTPDSFWLCFGFLCVTFLRTILISYAQDFLIPLGKISEIFVLQVLVSSSYLVSTVLVKVTNSEWRILPLLIMGLILLGLISSLFINRRFFSQQTGDERND